MSNLDGFRDEVFTLCLLWVFLGACSIHPVQQEYTGLKTNDIVKHIKCEAQAAIHLKVEDLLRIDRNETLAEQLRDRIQDYATVRSSHLITPKEIKFYDYYIKTGIAWDFTFDITEENKITAEFDPVGLLTGGKLAVAASATKNLYRQNQRKFVVSSTFADLLKLECDDQKVVARFDYPIAGSIGLAELISTFVDLNQEFLLKTEKDTSDGADKNFVPVFAETLTFKTTLSMSVNPTLTLSPTGHGLRVGGASIMDTVSRLDNHSVIVGISLHPTASLPMSQQAGTLSPFGGLQQRSVFARRSIAPMSAEERAILAITQQRLDTYLDRVGSGQIP